MSDLLLSNKESRLSLVLSLDIFLSAIFLPPLKTLLEKASESSGTESGVNAEFGLPTSIGIPPCSWLGPLSSATCPLGV